MQTDIYILHITGVTSADVANVLLALVPFVLMSGVALLYLFPLRRGERARRPPTASRSYWDEPV